MGYGVSEVYGLSPLSQLEKGPYVWDIKGYGLWQVWVIRSSTVASRRACIHHKPQFLRYKSLEVSQRVPIEPSPAVHYHQSPAHHVLQALRPHHLRNPCRRHRRPQLVSDDLQHGPDPVLRHRREGERPCRGKDPRVARRCRAGRRRARWADVLARHCHRRGHWRFLVSPGLLRKASESAY